MPQQSAKKNNLNLSDNQITTIDKNAFDGFKRLKSLYLYQNSIKSLSNIFSDDLAELTELNLEKNKVYIAVA